MTFIRFDYRFQKNLWLEKSSREREREIIALNATTCFCTAQTCMYFLRDAIREPGRGVHSAICLSWAKGNVRKNTVLSGFRTAFVAVWHWYIAAAFFSHCVSEEIFRLIKILTCIQDSLNIIRQLTLSVHDYWVILS